MGDVDVTPPVAAGSVGDWNDDVHVGNWNDDVHVVNLWVESPRYLKVTARGGRARASDRERTMAFHWAASDTKPFDQPEPQ